MNSLQLPFDKAPKAVLGALDLIRETSIMALHYDPKFNEILSAGYMEGQKMNVSNPLLVCKT